MSRRTIVGSPPRRKPLHGREAVERALALCKAWPPDPAGEFEFERQDDPRGACARAFWSRRAGVGRPYIPLWFPPIVAALETATLERLLAGGTLAGMGIDEVAP